MISRATLSGVVAGQQKFRSMLAGNAAFLPTAFNSIATITANGSSSSVTFSSIPATYASLQIRYSGSVDYGSLNNSSAGCYFNGDTNNANYYSHSLRGNGTTADSINATFPRVSYVLDSTIPANFMSTGIINIHNYASTTQNKVFRSFAGFNANTINSAEQRIGIFSSMWQNTAAINSITLTAFDGPWNSGATFSLYGIASA